MTFKKVKRGKQTCRGPAGGSTVLHRKLGYVGYVSVILSPEEVEEIILFDLVKLTACTASVVESHVRHDQATVL